MADKATSTATSGKLRCIVVTPETTLLEADYEFIVLPLADGELGIAPMHAPLIGALGYGELRLTNGGKVDRYYVDGGFVQVVNDVVAVLTNRALTGQQMEPKKIEEELAAIAANPGADREAREAQSVNSVRLKAQLKVAEKVRARDI